jgi:hypothetical protein
MALKGFFLAACTVAFGFVVAIFLILFFLWIWGQK